MSIEIRVLAAIAGNGDPKNIDIQKAMLQLREDCFQSLSCRGIFELINNLFKRKESFDVMKIMSLITEDNFQAFTDIAVLSSSTFTNCLENDVEHLLNVSKRKNMDRLLAQMMQEYKKEALPDVACAKAVESCLKLSNFALGETKHVFTSEQMAEKIFSDEYLPEPFVPTGIEVIDRKNKGGFKNKSLITIAAKPSTGKSCFAVFLAEKLAAHHHKKHVLFFSLEMTEYEAYQMQITSLANKQFERLHKDELFLAVSKSLECPFTINAHSLLSIDYIETFSRITNVQNPVGVIIVDYLSVVRNEGNFENKAEKQADIAMRLASLAKELDCIVIALSQINRDYANRQDKCPVTSDAADSSGSERSSSYWIALHRPALDAQHDPTLKNQFVVKCRKHRWGEPWTAYFAFNDATFGEVNQHLFYEEHKPINRQAKYKDKNFINETMGDV